MKETATNDVDVAVERTGRSAEQLRSDHPVWPLVAGYLAHLLHACVLVVSPQRIAVGGGVVKVPHLLPRVRQALAMAIDRELLLVLMVETPESVENADAIAAVPGVDVLLIGTNDLCA